MGDEAVPSHYSPAQPHPPGLLILCHQRARVLSAEAVVAICDRGYVRITMEVLSILEMGVTGLGCSELGHHAQKT